MFVIGGGPAGCRISYMLAKEGMKVLLAEKEPYPSDKICGDIVSPTVHDMLREMGVMHDLMQEGIGKWITSRGLVSPSGNSFVAEMGTMHDLSVQRILLDNLMKNAAQQKGSKVEQLKVNELTPPDVINGYWKIKCKTPENKEATYYSRYVVNSSQYSKN